MNASVLRISLMCLIAFGGVGCATVDASTAMGSSLAASSGNIARSSPALASSASVSLAIDVLGCVLEMRPSEPCRAIADRVGVPLTALQNASHAAAEMAGERVVAAARAENLPLAQRALVGEWFSRAMVAAREARAARRGATGVAMQACERMDHPSLERVEAAQQADVAAVRSHAGLASLHAYRTLADRLELDVEATALAILAHRIESVRMATSDVREEAELALREIVAQMGLARSSSTLTATNPSVSAHDRARAAEHTLDAAHSAIRERAAAIEGRLSCACVAHLVRSVALRVPPPRN